MKKKMEYPNLHTQQPLSFRAGDVQLDVHYSCLVLVCVADLEQEQPFCAHKRCIVDHGGCMRQDYELAGTQ